MYMFFVKVCFELLIWFSTQWLTFHQILLAVKQNAVIMFFPCKLFLSNVDR
uniref:Uncharacterized protein n=1 Tax=Anguilla anguilla TaxID=7936 RepID=A0A0E9W9Z6_ANGAN